MLGGDERKDKRGRGELKWMKERTKYFEGRDVGMEEVKRQKEKGGILKY